MKNYWRNNLPRKRPVWRKSRIPQAKLIKSLFALSLLGLLASCTNVSHKVAVVQDSAPREDVDVSAIADAVPRLDPITIAGNKNPYTINGVTYNLLASSKGYREVGLASWYGAKFHGRKTANGETYSMYGMTAAHKTLPIPAYAQVRNLANNRSVIVRINDRGPFHGDRIIDLSYAAAKKLGYAEQGTARVELIVIDPVAFQNNAVQAPAGPLKDTDAPASVAVVKNQPPRLEQSPEYLVGQSSEAADLASIETEAGELSSGESVSKSNGYLQLGAYTSRQLAAQHRHQVSGLITYPVLVEQTVDPARETALFKVMVGPVSSQSELVQLREYFRQSGRSEAFVVYNRSRTGL